MLHQLAEGGGFRQRRALHQADQVGGDLVWREIFGGIRSESEGIRLVKRSLSYCIKIRKPWLMIQVVTQSAGKLLGYKLGQRYERLPRKLVLACTMNREFWDKEEL